MDIKNKLIKLAYENPELREALLPIILKEAGFSINGSLFKSSKKFKNLKLRNKKYFREYVKSKYPKTPEYIIEDMVRSRRDVLDQDKIIDDLDWLGDVKKWDGPKVLNLLFSDFSEETQKRMIAREFGSSNPDEAPNDEARMEFQHKIITGDGKNEPVWLELKPGTKGYILQEGWHRTMALLGKRPRDKNGIPQGKILLNAFIAEY